MLTQLVWFQPPLPSPAISSQVNYPDEKSKVLMNRQAVNKPLCEAFTTLASSTSLLFSWWRCHSLGLQCSSCSSRLPLICVTPREGSRSPAACGEYRSTSYMSWTLPPPLITSHIHLPEGGGDGEHTSRLTHLVTPKENVQRCRCAVEELRRFMGCHFATAWFCVIWL